MSSNKIDPLASSSVPEPGIPEEVPHHEIKGAATDDERVEEAIDESFPASDPPSWNSGVEKHDTEA